jgi:hypothetical protein
VQDRDVVELLRERSEPGVEARSGSSFDQPLQVCHLGSLRVQE